MDEPCLFWPDGLHHVISNRVCDFRKRRLLKSVASALGALGQMPGWEHSSSSSLSS